MKIKNTLTVLALIGIGALVWKQYDKVKKHNSTNTPKIK